jgi:hypothetical protein
MSLRWNIGKRLFALALLMVCLGGASLVFGQVDPGWFQIFQNGVLVGEIYVPSRTADTPQYAEHWILYPNYVYPSPANGVKDEVVPFPRQVYTSEADFYRRAPFGPGYRYVRTACSDTTTLPGR